jgi:hypothetical protein
MSGADFNSGDLGKQQPGDPLDFLHLDEIASLAALCASYWHSVELAAGRGDVHLVALHAKQVGLVTREALALVREVAAETDPQKEDRVAGKADAVAQTRTGRNPAHAARK